MRTSTSAQDPQWPREVHSPSDAAVRELFRNLRSSTRLRRNPIVRSFFERAASSNDDHVILTTIRSQIMQIAHFCHAQDTTAGYARQARRQLAIVEATCAHEPANMTATKLGLSRSQFYRDRQVILRRVSRLMTRAKRASSQIQSSEPAR